MAHGLRTVLLLGLWICGDAWAEGKDFPPLNQPAPDFKLTTFDNRKITLADLKGQVVILNFWATWCGPCKAELPLLDAYYRKLHAAGLEIVAIATEDSLTPFQLRPVQKVVSFSMIKHFKGDYGRIKALPTNFVIDRSGNLRYGEAGAFSLADLNRIVVPLLNEHAL